MIEILSVMTSFLCLIGISKQKTWAWPISIISATLFLITFLNVRLYSEVSLQVIYIIQGFYGWYTWKNNESNAKSMITSLTIVKTLQITLVTFLIGIIIGFFINENTDCSQPYLNTIIACFSLVANWLMIKKHLEAWLFWVIVNILGLEMFLQEGMYLSLGLYVIFMVVSIKTFLSWNKITKA